MNELVPKPEGKLNPYQNYARAVAIRRLDGERLHFNKGAWLVGENGVLEDGATLVAIVPQLRIGWVKFRANAKVDEAMGYLSEGFVPPRRDQLDDDDGVNWEKQPDGQTKDPWTQVNELVMISPENDEVFTLTTGSKGGFAAIGGLCADFAPDFGMYPLVRPSSDSYQHKVRAYGRIYVPLLPVLKWVEAAPFDAILAKSRGKAAVETPKPIGSGPDDFPPDYGDGGGEPENVTF
jgi:hypothetical protein